MIIDAYDLIFLLMSMENIPESLTARKINIISKRLSEIGIESRFFISSFEAVQIEYPGCLSVSRTEISICSPKQLMQIRSQRMNNDIINVIKRAICNE